MFFRTALITTPQQFMFRIVSRLSSLVFINLNAKCTGTNGPISPAGPSVCEEATTVPLPDGRRIEIAPLPWYRMALESLTMYGELSAARIPEEFAPVRLRLQLEWTFNGGFVSRSTFMLVFDSQLIVHSMNSL